MVKKCPKCQIIKPLIYFYKSKSRYDGVQYIKSAKERLLIKKS